MTRADGYANTILEFRTRNTGSYASSNNLTRMTRQEFMLNEIRLTGNFTGQSNFFRQGSGQQCDLCEEPRRRRTKDSLGRYVQRHAARFEFLITNEMLLLDDLEITGNGTQATF